MIKIQINGGELRENIVIIVSDSNSEKLRKSKKFLLYTLEWYEMAQQQTVLRECIGIQTESKVILPLA